MSVAWFCAAPGPSARSALRADPAASDPARYLGLPAVITVVAVSPGQHARLSRHVARMGAVGLDVVLGGDHGAFSNSETLPLLRVAHSGHPEPRYVRFATVASHSAAQVAHRHRTRLPEPAVTCAGESSLASCHSATRSGRARASFGWWLHPRPGMGSRILNGCLHAFEEKVTGKCRSYLGATWRGVNARTLSGSGGTALARHARGGTES